MPHPSQQGLDGDAKRPHARLGTVSLWLLGIAVVVDLLLYRAADKSGKQALLEPFTLIVMAIACLGVLTALLSLLERGRRRGAALLLIPLHLLLGAAFCFALAMLA